MEAKSGVDLESGKITDSRGEGYFQRGRGERYAAREDEAGGRSKVIDWLDECRFVRGIFVEVVSGFAEGLRVGGLPDQESGCGRSHAPDEPNELFHTCFPSGCSIRSY